eukprot:CAMPEP_0177700308 /NCGR_PEP_ID=MMETSP0484_2-20121128/6028_1 /TAXON_ID=354590 /ORGANISM="Rhodomonas lens, Strain RHODO" /LENGTH=585 /DNA_ID=CAMNT_0019211505 /DNA_START=191 /DNA_END=1945 /DNA_ORIENTATION=-
MRALKARVNKDVAVRGVNKTLVFIIGARRGGTEALNDFLLQHPAVCPFPHELGKHDADTGKRHMALESTEWFIESLHQNLGSACRAANKTISTQTMTLVDNVPNMLVTARNGGEGKKAAAGLQEAATIKFVVVLREPVERDLSWFNYQKGKGSFFARGVHPESSHAEVAEKSLLLAKTHSNPLVRHTLQNGYYAAQLQEWIKVWGKESTLVLSHDTLVKDTRTAATALASFLGLPGGSRGFERAKLTVQRAAKTGQLAREQMEKQTCEKLEAAYVDHNAALYALLAEPGWPASQPPFPPFGNPCNGTKPGPGPRAARKGGLSSRVRQLGMQQSKDMIAPGKTQKERAEERKRMASMGRGESLEDEWSAKEIAKYIREHGKPPPMSTQTGELDIKWPTVFIVAAPKSASSSLAEMLFKHPKFCHPEAPKGHRVPWDHHKEIHFFAKRSLLRKGWKFYLKHFGHAEQCQSQTTAEGWWHVDGTPSYMMSKSARTEMPNVMPKPLHSKLRFIAVLREPVARDLSWYNHQKSVNMSPKVRSVKSYSDYATRALKPFEDGTAAKMEQKMRAAEEGQRAGGGGGRDDGGPP